MISYGQHVIDESDIAAVVDVLRNGYLTQGPKLHEFEEAFAGRVDAKFAVGVSSCTAALHIACLAAGIGRGDIIATSPNTFVASSNCALYVGAKPIFIDIDMETLNLSPEKLQQQFHKNSNIKAIIPVHFGGLPADMKRIQQIASDNNSIIIEDAAHALGAKYECGSPVGSCKYSHMSVFSFHPIKSITSGEGGMITTNDEQLYKKLLLLRNHGIEKEAECFIDRESGFEGNKAQPWYYEQQLIGFNYRLSDIHAVLGLSQLSRLEQFLSLRREIAAYYDSKLINKPNIKLTQYTEDSRTRSALHLYVVLIDFNGLGKTRVQIMQKLRESGIGTQVHYIPVYKHPYYRSEYSSEETSCRNMEHYYSCCLTLPIHPALDNSDLEKIITNIYKLTNYE